jgi:glycosyltransferase involved in cell wall biosynthesis
LRILVIGYLHKKHDKRVFRIINALSKNNEVIYQYRSEEAEKPYIGDNIKFLPVYYIRDKSTPPIKELLKRRGFDFEIMNIIKSTDFDILYLHHFPATKPLEPFKIAKRLGKKIIYDIHEYHPYNFLNSLSGIKKKLKEKIMLRIFKKQLEYSNKLIFVSLEVKEEVFQTLNIERDTLIVPNYAVKGIESTHKNDREIVLVGGTKRYLSNEKLILKKLIELGWKFKIVGMDSSFLKDVKHIYTGFLPYDEMLIEVSKASFSLISYNTTEDMNYKNDLFALPHKYYDSLAAETPVIVNKRFVSMAKEVEKLGIGVVIDTEKPDEAVKSILKAYDDYETLIENIRKYKKNFIWDEEKEKEFVDFVCDS